MERWHSAFRTNDKEFKELFGVKKEIFHAMLAVLTDAREKRRRKGSPRPKRSVGDPLLLTLQYWREYRTMAHLADTETREILCTAQDKGAAHDFPLFKRTIRAIIFEVLLLADSGYQGLLALHGNSRIPFKKSKNHPLTDEGAKVVEPNFVERANCHWEHQRQDQNVQNDERKVSQPTKKTPC